MANRPDIRQPIIRFEGISKRFAGVTALRDVSFEIRAGECHALVGENGAGKSTIDKLVREGAAILLISSELSEILNLSTRIIALREGRLMGELPRNQVDQESLMRLMAGVATAAPSSC